MLMYLKSFKETPYWISLVTLKNSFFTVKLMGKCISCNANRKQVRSRGEGLRSGHRDGFQPCSGIMYVYFRCSRQDWYTIQYAICNSLDLDSYSLFHWFSYHSQTKVPQKSLFFFLSRSRISSMEP